MKLDKCVVFGTLTEIFSPFHFWPVLGDDLMRCVDLYNQAQSKWFEEMVTTSLVCCVVQYYMCFFSKICVFFL